MSDAVERHLWMSWDELWEALAAALVIYLAVVLLTRLFGQRSISPFSTFDFPVSVAIGAVVGRTALIHPSLLGGVVALAALFTFQASARLIRNRTRLGAPLDNRPIVIVENGEIRPGQLRRAHMTYRDLNERLRQSGVRRMADVSLVVMERNGRVSVITGGPVDDELLRDLR